MYLEPLKNKEEHEVALKQLLILMDELDQEKAYLETQDLTSVEIDRCLAPILSYMQNFVDRVEEYENSLTKSTS